MLYRLRVGLRVSNLFLLTLALTGISLMAEPAVGQHELPAIERITAPLVSPLKAEVELRRRAYGLSRSVGLQTVSTTAAATAAPEVVELARGLRHDPDLIYEYVHNTIRYAPSFGLRKGPAGTIIDREGNSFDQAALMVALLRESGHTANFLYGTVRLDAAQVTNWLGIADNAVLAEDVFSAAGIPATIAAAGSQIAYVEKAHVWVQASIDGTDYVFDPALKSHTWHSGIDLPAAMGYDATTFRNNALNGATVTATSVQNLNHANIENDLQTYAGNLISDIRTNNPGVTLDGVVGGAEINPVGSVLRQTSLPHQQAITATWIDIPSTHRVSVRVRYQVIDQTMFADEIYGRRLTIHFAQTGGSPAGTVSPFLSLAGNNLQIGDHTDPGTKHDISIDVDNPYAANGGTYGDIATTRQLEVGVAAIYNLTIGIGKTSRRMVEKHQRLLEKARALDPTELTEQLKGEAVATIGYNSIAQVMAAQDLADRMNRISTIHHQWIEIVGFGGGLFVDSVAATLSFVSNEAVLVEAQGAHRNFSGFLNAFEAYTIEQTQDVPAASAVGFLYQASGRGDAIYDTVSATWAALKPSLVNYSAGEIALVESYLAEDYRVILPRDGNLQIGSFQGVGIYAVKDGKMAPVITGGAKGAHAGGAVGGDSLVDKTKNATRPTDPRSMSTTVDLASGRFKLSRTDFSVGGDAFPYGLEFKRFYDSGDWWRDGPMGAGWSHSFDYTVESLSNGFPALGEDTPISAAAAIAALYVAHDVLAGGDSADRVTMSSVIHEWLFEHLQDNILAVRQPGPDMIFVKLADGSYNPPRGDLASIEEQSGGGYLLTLKDQTELTFGSHGKITLWQNASNFWVQFNYDSLERLSHVQNKTGWVLQFQHTTGKRIRKVKDSNNRDVEYFYTSGELQRFEDTQLEFHSFDYDANWPGHLTAVTLPSNSNTVFLGNSYDTLGRIASQTNALGNIWQYYYGDGRSSKADPLGNETVVYFDDKGHPTQTIDALGNVSFQEFDGLGRLVRRSMPEGDSLSYIYDVNHNVSKIVANPKPGSSLQPVERNFVYDLIWNKLVSATDALNQTTDFSLDPTNGNLLEVKAPIVDGVRPTTTYTYNSHGQVSTLTDPEGMVTAYDYSVGSTFVGGGLLTSVTVDDGRLGLQTEFRYDWIGNLDRITDPRNKSTYLSYDDERRVIEVRAPHSQKTKFSYDEDGRLSAESRIIEEGNFPWQTVAQTSSHSYNAAGDRVRTIAPGNRETLFEYDSTGRLVKTTDPEGRIVESVYDALGRTQRVVETTDLTSGATQNSITYTYWPNGNRKSLTDANGNSTSYSYDGFDRLSRATFPDLSYEEVSYDSNANVLTRRSRAGDSFAYGYDALNRLVSETVPYSSIDITYAYDLVGRTLTTTDERGTISNAYDTAGRLISVADPSNKTVGYEYDAAGNRTKLTWPDSFFVTYEFDSLNRIVSIKENGSKELAQYDYDILSRRIRTTFGNGGSVFYKFKEKVDDLEYIDQNLPSGTVRFDYTYNNNGERISQTVGDDLYLWRPAGSASDTYAANNLNQYSQVNSVSQVYDSNGNLTDDGANSFTFDAKNRLLTAVNPSHTSSYEYDALDRRIAKTVDGIATQYVLDGAMEIAEYDGPTDSLLFRYIYGPGSNAPIAEISSNGAQRFFHTDAIGSVVAVQPGTAGSGPLEAQNPQTGTVSLPGYTVDAGTNRVLIVAVRTSDLFGGSAPIVKYGNTPLTLVETASSTFRRASLYHLPESQLVAGTQTEDITATKSNGGTYNSAQIVAFVLTDVDQSRLSQETAKSSSSSTAVSASLTTSSDGVVVVSAVALYGGVNWQPSEPDEYVISTHQTVGASYELVSSASSITMGWAGSAGKSSMVMASYGLLNPPTGGSEPPPQEEHYAYGPFGEGSGAGNGIVSFRYAGHRYDRETGLYYMRARYYSTAAGRFLSADPIGYSDGPNLYAYVHNSPLNYIDPLGLESILGTYGHYGKSWGWSGFVGMGQGIVQSGVDSTFALGYGALGMLSQRPQYNEKAAMAFLFGEGVPQVFAAPINAEQAEGRVVGQIAIGMTGASAGSLMKTGAKIATKLHRPYLRVATRRAIMDAAPKTPDGRFIDPNDGLPIDGPFHFGHKYGHENWRILENAQQRGLTQAQLNDLVNRNPQWFQIERPENNWGHQYEMAR